MLTHKQVSSQSDPVQDCELFFFILAAMGVQNYTVIVGDLFVDILLEKNKEIDKKDRKKKKKDNKRNVAKIERAN